MPAHKNALATSRRLAKRAAYFTAEKKSRKASRASGHAVRALNIFAFGEA